MSVFSTTAKKKAVAYFRHSAEDKQENSVPIQREQAYKFAAAFNIEIIHEEADEGKSGLLATRPGFERLFTNWITKDDAPAFDYVLVLDVSRWGRFQDQDEAAYYEFRCKQRGKKVIYFSRGFPKEEQQLITHLQTSIERYMAAEYSRQLSDKVFHGCVKVSEQGFSAGGTSCYGMARLLLDSNKKPIRILKRGEHKQIANERVTFVPLNDETTGTVKEIFRLFLNSWNDLPEIAEQLNTRGLRSASGGLWNREKILNILTNETYTGARIYNKTWGRLKQLHRNNPRNEWVIRPNSFPAIIDPDDFSRAQENLYWLLPSKWRKGIRSITRVQNSLRLEMKTSLQNRGLGEEEIFHVLSNLPIVFSVTYFRQDVPHWCFSIDEGMRRHKAMLGISILLDHKNPIDRFFMLPADSFSDANYLLLSESDEQYKDFFLPHDQVQAAIMRLADNLLTPKKAVIPQTP